MTEDKRIQVKDAIVGRLNDLLKRKAFAHLKWVGTEAEQLVSVNANGIASIRADVLLAALEAPDYE